MDFDALHHKQCYVEFVQKTEDKRAVKPQSFPANLNAFNNTNRNKSAGSVIIKKESNEIIPGKYIEEEKIPGNDIQEVIANISQKDALDETLYDSYRCGTSSLLNAYLILGGNFEKLAVKFNTGNDLTYKNIHLVQDKMYKSVKTSRKVGLESSYVYHFNNSGFITRAKSTGEINNAAREIGLELTPIIGKSIKTINQKKDAVDNFFNTKAGALQVSVYLNPATGKITNNYYGMQNHYVMVFKRDNNYFLADTGQRFNGNGTNIKKLDDTEVNDLIFNSPALISGVTIQQNTLFAEKN